MGRIGKIASVIIHDEGQVGSAIIVERRVQNDSGPHAFPHGYEACIHTVGLIDRNPIGVAAERRLAGMDKVYIVAPGFFISGIEEGKAVDGEAPTQFAGSINLLRQAVFVV